MAKYDSNTVKVICELISTDSYTIAEICRKVNITEATFFNWKSRKVEFLESIKKAESQFLETIAVEAKRSLVKKVKGYDYNEVQTIYTDSGVFDDEGKSIPKIKKKTVTTKHVPPSDAMVIFALTNRDGENWKNKQFTESTGELKISSQFSKMSNEELNMFINEQNEVNK